MNGIGCFYQISQFINPLRVKQVNLAEFEHKNLSRVNVFAFTNANNVYENILGQLTKPEIVAPVRPAMENSTFTPKNNTYFKSDLPPKNDTPVYMPAAAPPPRNNDIFNKLVYENDTQVEEKINKIQLLEDIKCLRLEMEKQKIAMDSIPEVNEYSHIDEIVLTYKILRKKKNSQLNYETTRDVLMIGINEAVKFFDGSGNRPNLNGWNHTAKYKLSSLKSELASVSENLFNKFDLGPISQILISLVPSAIIHARTISEQNNKRNVDDKIINNLENL